MRHGGRHVLGHGTLRLRHFRGNGIRLRRRWRRDGLARRDCLVGHWLCHLAKRRWWQVSGNVRLTQQVADRRRSAAVRDFEVGHDEAICIRHARSLLHCAAGSSRPGRFGRRLSPAMESRGSQRRRRARGARSRTLSRLLPRARAGAARWRAHRPARLHERLQEHPLRRRRAEGGRSPERRQQPHRSAGQGPRTRRRLHRHLLAGQGRRGHLAGLGDEGRLQHPGRRRPFSPLSPDSCRVLHGIGVMRGRG